MGTLRALVGRGVHSHQQRYFLRQYQSVEAGSWRATTDDDEHYVYAIAL